MQEEQNKTSSDEADEADEDEDDDTKNEETRGGGRRGKVKRTVSFGTKIRIELRNGLNMCGMDFSKKKRTQLTGKPGLQN